MVFVNDAPPLDRPALPLRRRAPLRLYLLGRATLMMITSLVGVLIFSVWITVVAISPLTVFAPLVIPATALLRGYADMHRRGAQYLIGTPVRGRYRRPNRNGVVHRVWTIERDPASWRDALWAFVHSAVACFTSCLAFSLFVGGIFYLIYPFLYWVTPPRVFSHPFGGLVHLHSVGQACGMMPLALVAFGLWYALAVPLARADVAITRSLLSGRSAD
jgi:hypothetical protein